MHLLAGAIGASAGAPKEVIFDIVSNTMVWQRCVACKDMYAVCVVCVCMLVFSLSVYVCVMV